MSPSRVLRVARLSPFVVVLVAPLVASGFGLVAVGHDWLGLGSWLGLLVPLTLDAAALSFAFLAWQATLDDEPAGLERLLVWVYAGASAGLNMWHSDAIGGLHRAAFFGAASLTGALVWERVLHAIQRRQLRARGRIEKPAPRFRALRWLLFPVETAGAFRYAVGEEVSDPRTAIEAYRRRNEPAIAEDESTAAEVDEEEASEDRPTDEHAKAVPAFTLKPESTKAPRPAAPEPPAQPEPEAATERAPELVGLSNAAATRHAFEVIGALDGGEARKWLAARGVVVDKSQAAKLAKRAAAEASAAEEENTSPRLVAVGEDR